MTFNLDEQKELRNQAWKELRKIHSMMLGVKATYDELKSQYEEAKALYEKMDYELALIDGRYQKVLAAAAQADANGKVKKTKERDLTDDEIMRIAKELGVELPEVEDENEGGDESN